MRRTCSGSSHIYLASTVDVKSRMWHRVIATTLQPSLAMASPYVSRDLIEAMENSFPNSVEASSKTEDPTVVEPVEDGEAGNGGA